MSRNAPTQHRRSRAATIPGRPSRMISKMQTWTGGSGTPRSERMQWQLMAPSRACLMSNPACRVSAELSCLLARSQTLYSYDCTGLRRHDQTNGDGGNI